MVIPSPHLCLLHKSRLIKIFFVASWFQFIIFLAAITFLSLTPNPGSAFEHVSDKILHVIGWSSMSVSLGLPWLVSVFFNSNWLAYRTSSRLKKYLFAASLLFVYSIAIEFIQQYTGRQLSGWDMVANSVGVILGSWVIWVLSRRMEVKRNLRSV